MVLQFSPAAAQAGYRLGWRRSALLGLALALLTFTFHLHRLETTRAAGFCNNCVLGSDVGDYGRALEAGTYGGLKHRKHPLAIGAVTIVAVPLSSMGVPVPLAGSIALAFIQAIGALAFFALLRRNFLGREVSAAHVALFFATFSTITLLSVPETYGVTLTAAAIALLAFGELARVAPRSPLAMALAAGAIGALPGWANLPAVAFILGYTGFAWPRLSCRFVSKAFYAAVLPILVATTLTLLPTLAIDLHRGFAWQSQYIESYASLGNFTDGRILADYLPSFFLYPVVSPLDHVLCRFTAGDAASASLPRVAAWLLSMLLLTAGFLRSVFSPRRRAFAITMAAIVGCFFCFYLFFNPDEALLYSPQWMLAAFAGAAAGLTDRRWLVVSVGTLFLCLGLNIAPLGASQTRDPATCCPSPPATDAQFSRNRV